MVVINRAYKELDNYTEATQETFLVLRERYIPDIISEASPIDLTRVPLSAFKVLVAATKIFLERSGGVLPLGNDSLYRA